MNDYTRYYKIYCILFNFFPSDRYLSYPWYLPVKHLISLTYFIFCIILNTLNDYCLFSQKKTTFYFYRNLSHLKWDTKKSNHKFKEMSSVFLMEGNLHKDRKKLNKEEYDKAPTFPFTALGNHNISSWAWQQVLSNTSQVCR